MCFVAISFGKHNGYTPAKSRGLLQRRSRWFLIQGNVSKAVSYYLGKGMSHHSVLFCLTNHVCVAKVPHSPTNPNFLSCLPFFSVHGFIVIMMQLMNRGDNLIRTLLKMSSISNLGNYKRGID